MVRLQGKICAVLVRNRESLTQHMRQFGKSAVINAMLVMRVKVRDVVVCLFSLKPNPTSFASLDPVLFDAKSGSNAHQLFHPIRANTTRLDH